MKQLLCREIVPLIFIVIIFNKILVVFRCFGELDKFYLFLGLSGIFTGPLRVFLGNMGVFLGKCMDRHIYSTDFWSR